MSFFNIALIGCGAAAKRYYLPALQKIERQLGRIFFVDTNIKFAEGLAKNFVKANFFGDYRDIIAEFQGAIVCVPNQFHYSVCLDLLNAGVHVLCEKPLSETAQEAEVLCRVARQQKLVLCVNNTRRIFPTFREVKNILDRGEIGQVRHILFNEGNAFAWPSATGFYVNPKVSTKGVMADIGSHILDLFCWWLGEKPELIEFKDDSYGGPESVAHMKARIKECNIDLFLNRLCNINNSFIIRGTLGEIEGNVFDWKHLQIKLYSGQSIQMKFKTRIYNFPQFVSKIVKNFMAASQGKEKPYISGQDVIPSIHLMEECYARRIRFELPWFNRIKAIPIKEGRVLVTGAAGFIGCRVVEMLYLTNSRMVRAGIKQWASAARLGRFPVDIVLLDLMDRKQIEDALDGVTDIIHCAYGPSGVTVEGTRNLLEVAGKKAIRRIVHLSTIEVYGQDNGVISEQYPLTLTDNEYNKTKVQAEQICWEFYEKGLPVSIIRPSIVYGPFSRNWTLYFARLLADGKWTLSHEQGLGQCNLIYVDDLVRGIIAVLDHAKGVGEAFNINGPDVVTWNEYFQRFNKMMGFPSIQEKSIGDAKLHGLLIKPLRYAGQLVKNHFMEQAKQLAGYSSFAKTLMKKAENTLKMSASPETLKLYNRQVFYDAQKAKNLLGFTPETSLDEGLEITCEWLRHQKIIAREVFIKP